MASTNNSREGWKKNPESNYIEVRAPFGAYDLCCSFDVLFDQFNAQCVQRDREASNRPRVDQPNKMKNHTIIKVDRLIDLSTTIVWVLFVGASFRNWSNKINRANWREDGDGEKRIEKILLPIPINRILSNSEQSFDVVFNRPSNQTHNNAGASHIFSYLHQTQFSVRRMPSSNCL